MILIGLPSPVSSSCSSKSRDIEWQQDQKSGYGVNHVTFLYEITKQLTA